MADAIDEASDIAAISSALVLNIGTLNERTIPAMLAAGKSANLSDIPVVLDPVGVGASKLRNDTALSLINEIRLTVLRGNISEIKFMAGLESSTKGVDASESDLVNLNDAGYIAKELAKKLGCVVVISGVIDILSDGKRTIYCENGHPMLGNLSGTGCMCSSLIASFCGIKKDDPFSAAVTAMLSMGVAGELAFEQAGHLGSGSFHIALRDALSRLDAETLERMARYRET
jgi:hydroxyethylthiazole kinase